MKKIFGVSLLVAVTGGLIPVAHADEVTDWNAIMLDSLRTAGVGGVLATRPAATVQTAVFDALNGIERRYGHIRVEPDAAPGASRRAAVVQAAYASLVALFPAQKVDLDAKRAVSLAAIASGPAVEHSQSVARGLEWGQTVAAAIVAWRSADGFTPAPPPNVGGNAIGQWRPTPTAFAPFAAVQLGFTTPWVIATPLQFPLPGPPALTSTRYAADFNEVKDYGSATSALRSADQTFVARFWASGSSPNYFWNRVAVRLATAANTTLSENARLLALLNIAMADSGIVVWRGKFDYGFWRPITAIQLADLDNNPATASSATWTPLLVTPPYPDYPSGLVGVSSAGVAVLANYFGENTNFYMESDAAPMVGVRRTFTRFSDAGLEMVDARIWSGIHFRFADEDALLVGTRVGNYVAAHAAQPLKGKHTGQVGK